MGKIALYEGIGDIFGRRVDRGSRDEGSGRKRRRHSKHNIKSSAVRRQNQKMKECAVEYHEEKREEPDTEYRSFMASCLRK